jgi:hypothetical protein
MRMVEVDDALECWRQHRFGSACDGRARLTLRAPRC